MDEITVNGTALHFIPRIGQEVLIDFIAGDIDRPVVVGQLYNGEDTPPFHGADNHPGALAGIKSKEYFGGGWNQWVIDDTPSQLRQSVSSTYEATQLNIGYLIRQHGNVRGAYRGLGFELATDAWATMTASTDMRVTGEQAVTIATGKAASLFTHSGGAKVFAAKEPVSVRAHTGPMDLIADKAITITSSNDEVRISAKEELLLASGGGYIRLKGNDIDIHCPATISVKGTLHDVLGAAGTSAELPLLPNADLKLSNWIAINYRDAEGEPMAGVGYKIKFDSGGVLTGKLDENGHARHDNVPESSASVEYEKRKPKDDAPWPSLQQMVAKAQERFGSKPQ